MERLAAERATSTARVLTRRRRRRTVPGPRPINPPRFVAMYRGVSAVLDDLLVRGSGRPGRPVAPDQSRAAPDQSRTAPDQSRAAPARRTAAGSNRRRAGAKARRPTPRRNRRPITALQRRRRVFLA